MENFLICEQHDELLGKVYRMECQKDGCLASEALLAPEKGFNLFYWAAAGFPILYCLKEELAATGFGGMPVLYPAPNRTENGKFTYDGRAYQLEKNGSAREIHGLVYDEPWQVEGTKCTDGSCQVAGRIDFTKGSRLFASFPFEHSLQVTYRLTADSLSMAYLIESRSDRPFPLGLGVHTYFTEPEPDITLKVPTGRRFFSDSLHFPHGIGAVEGAYDLRTPKNVKTLDLDDVYTDLGGKTSEIIYPSLQKKLCLSGSEAFQNAVVFTPPGEPFFCYENQTCMTNALNSQELGLYEESGLIILEPGASCSGNLRFRLEDLKG